MKRAQTALCGNTFECDQAHLCAHFTFLANIDQPEWSSPTLTRKVELILVTRERFATIPNGPVADGVIPNFDVSEKSTGFSAVTELFWLANILHYQRALHPLRFRTKKYVPLTSEFLSAYKLILSEKMAWNEARKSWDDACLPLLLQLFSWCLVALNFTYIL